MYNLKKAAIVLIAVGTGILGGLTTFEKLADRFLK